MTIDPIDLRALSEHAADIAKALMALQETSLEVTIITSDEDLQRLIDESCRLRDLAEELKKCVYSTLHRAYLARVAQTRIKPRTKPPSPPVHQLSVDALEEFLK